MANDEVVFVRMESYVKKGAEMILEQLGVTPTDLVTMLYHQIILKQKIPFEISITKDGARNMNADNRTISLKDLDKILKDRYGIEPIAKK